MAVRGRMRASHAELARSALTIVSLLAFIVATIAVSAMLGSALGTGSGT